MSYYQIGLSFRMPSPVSRFMGERSRAASMIWHHLKKGESNDSTYRRGSRAMVRSAGSTTDSIVDTLVEFTHILLIVGGMWLLITAIMAA